jgi:CMP-N,N'-diacetyllegionaminic acid synthase
MINGKRIMAIIPARGGSKGVPRKNVRVVGGKPLIAWTIEEAKKSKYIDRLILSSDDSEIIRITQSWGCEVPFVRPAELSQDETPGIAPVLHALEAVNGYDYVVLLQPTSPLRSVIDIDSCIETMVQKNAKSCVSVTETDKSPYWMYTIGDNQVMDPVMKQTKVPGRRQDIEKTYYLNGAIYVADCEWLKTNESFISNETIAFIMPKERSWDIDTERDLLQVDTILTEKMCLEG